LHAQLARLAASPCAVALRQASWYNARMSSSLKIGFLGAGKMATALARGFTHAGLVAPDGIIASDPYEPARVAFGKEAAAKTTGSNPDVLKFADVLLLAVKPDQVNDVLAEARPHFTARHLLISIAAGVPIARIENALCAGARVVRVMPNTPALVGASASAFALGTAAQPEDARLAQKLFSAVGVAYQVKESLLDAVTGLSGSGPAYVFLIIEALSDGGVAAGLPREIATKLAAQTLLGSAKLLLETGQHPGVLKDMVTSPGGTTIEGLHELEEAGVRGALINAVRAATEKSKKLGQG
jgi:pyrroline-5-carboxylate reductase